MPRLLQFNEKGFLQSFFSNQIYQDFLVYLARRNSCKCLMKNVVWAVKKTQEMPDEPERRQTSFRMIQKIKCLQNLLISSLQNYICREFFKIFIQKFNKSNSMKIIYIPNSLYRKTTTKYSLSSLPYTHSIIAQLL